MQHGETIHSLMPQDLPWWMADHATFFGVLYMVLIIIDAAMVMDSPATGESYVRRASPLPRSSARRIRGFAMRTA